MTKQENQNQQHQFRICKAFKILNECHVASCASCIECRTIFDIISRVYFIVVVDMPNVRECLDITRNAHQLICV